MHKMPRVWLDYLELLLEGGGLTATRRAFDRALAALPITQHDRVWPLYLVRAGPFLGGGGVFMVLGGPGVRFWGASVSFVRRLSGGGLGRPGWFAGAGARPLERLRLHARHTLPPPALCGQGSVPAQTPSRHVLKHKPCQTKPPKPAAFRWPGRRAR